MITALRNMTIYHSSTTAVCLYWSALWYIMLPWAYYRLKVRMLNDKTMNCLNHAEFQQDRDYEIMVGHYLLFLSHLNRCLFTFCSVLLTKWECASSKNAKVSKGLQFVQGFSDMMYPILIWLCIKFRYHFPMELLLFGVANLIQPISYFFWKCGYGNTIKLDDII